MRLKLSSWSDRFGVLVAVGVVTAGVLALPASAHVCTFGPLFAPTVVGSNIQAHAHTDCSAQDASDRLEVRLYRVVALAPDDRWATGVDTPPAFHADDVYSAAPAACEDPGAHIMQTWANFTSTHASTTGEQNTANALSCA